MNAYLINDGCVILLVKSCVGGVKCAWTNEFPAQTGGLKGESNREKE